MYMSSGQRPHISSYGLTYDELPFSINKTGNPINRHKRIRTEQYDRQSILERELWDLERRDLQAELDIQRNSHRKSMRMIKELIEDNHRHHEKTKISSEQDSCHYYPDLKPRSLYTSESCFSYLNKPEKQFEKPSNKNLSNTTIINSSSSTKNNTQNIYSNYSKYKNNKNTLVRFVSESRLGDKIQEKATTPIKAQLENKSTKQVIFRKLYEDHSKKQQKNKQIATPQKQSPSQQIKTPSKTYHQYQITFLKEQLQEKNRQIIDLQIELIKLGKNSSRKGSARKDCEDNNPEKDILQTRIREFSLQKKIVNIKIEPKNQKFQQLSQVQVKANSNSGVQKSFKRIPKIEMHAIEDIRILGNVSGSTQQFSQHLVEERFEVLTLQIDELKGQLIQRQQKQDELIQQLHMKKQQIDELVVQHQEQLVKIRTQIQEVTKCNIKNQHQWGKDKQKFMQQATILKQQLQKRQETIKKLQNQIVCLEQATQAVSKQQVGVQTKQKKMKDRHTSTQPQISLQGLQAQIVLTDTKIKTDAQCQTWVSLIDLQENSSQTSQNMYDYIEETYLEWMFEKQYKELERRKNKNQKHE